MKEKIFQNTRTQIGILKSRGVIIKNKRFAKQKLSCTNYYNLINGYKDPFLQTDFSYESYLPGTTFEEIYALYEFDRQLRLITLEYILEIEKQIKSHIAYCFSQKYGHKDYLKIENFDNQGIRKYSKVCNLLSNLYNKITLNLEKDLSIIHYVDGKNYIPLWILVNSVSMGDISKFYLNIKQSEREAVARRIKWGLRENQLANILFFLSTIRNRCAHDERLYSYLSYTSLCNNKYFQYFHITTKRNNYFSVMIALKIILSDKRFIDYYNQIENLFSKTASQIKTIHINKIRKIMGFPNNWNKIKTL